jgi:hypothetical protein
METQAAGGTTRAGLRRLMARVRLALHGRPDEPPPSEPADESSISFLASLTEDERDLVDRVQPFSLTSPERIMAVRDAVAYVVRRNIQGAFVECGVWRGGSVLAMILTLQHHGVDDREIYLYDTFEGMTEPDESDRSTFGEQALTTWQRANEAGEQAWNSWFKPEVFNLDQVKQTLGATGYPTERLHYVKGPVEETIPAEVPDGIALLRLDTDWYESTKHELVHLYPILADGGVLLIDDYGHWEGCRRAVDEYFAEATPLLLSRIDYTARMAVKH